MKVIIDQFFFGDPYSIDPDSSAIALELCWGYDEIPKGIYLTTPWAPTLRMIVQFPENHEFSWEINIYWVPGNELFITQLPCEDNQTLNSAFIVSGQVSYFEYNRKV